MCVLEGEDDLADFMIEIDILTECKHPNIVQLYEAFFVNSKLWVNNLQCFSRLLLIPAS